MNIGHEKRNIAKWCSGLEYPCGRSSPLSLSPNSPPETPSQRQRKEANDIFQAPTATALGSSAALGGAAAMVAVTASAIPLIHHSMKENLSLSSNRPTDVSRCISPSHTTFSRRLDGGSILSNGNSMPIHIFCHKAHSAGMPNKLCNVSLQIYEKK